MGHVWSQKMVAKYFGDMLMHLRDIPNMSAIKRDVKHDHTVLQSENIRAQVQNLIFLEKLIMIQVYSQFAFRAHFRALFGTTPSDLNRKNKG